MVDAIAAPAALPRDWYERMLRAIGEPLVLPTETQREAQGRPTTDELDVFAGHLRNAVDAVMDRNPKLFKPSEQARG